MNRVPGKSAVLACLVIVLLAGCASTVADKRPAYDQRIDAGKVWILSGKDADFASTRPDGKAKSAGIGLTGGAIGGALGGALASAGFGPFAPLVAPVLIPLGAVLGGAGGATHAAVTAPSKDVLEANLGALERAREDAVRDPGIGARVAERLIELSHRYQDHELAAPRLDEGDAAAFVETPQVKIAVTDFSLQGSKSMFLRLSVKTRVDIDSNPDNAFDLDFEIVRGPHTFTEWTAHNAMRFRNAVDEMHDGMAEQIMYRLFTGIAVVQRPTADQQNSGRADRLAEPELAMAGFAPVFPPVHVKWNLSVSKRTIGNSYSEVDRAFRLEPEPVAVRPVTLVWEPFPGTYRPDYFAPARRFVDLPSERVENVRYDLAIWRLHEASRRFIVFGWDTHYSFEPFYFKSGLEEPWHTIEETLCDECRYAWTVRASFERDGQPVLTPWSATEYPHMVSIVPPSRMAPAQYRVNRHNVPYPWIYGRVKQRYFYPLVVK